jgi:prevent-host-death family protein
MGATRAAQATIQVEHHPQPDPRLPAAVNADRAQCVEEETWPGYLGQVMTIHVNIGEAKTRLSELVAAALRGEEVVLDKAGAPQVKLVPVAGAEEARRQELAARRKAAFGMFAERYRHLHGTEALDAPPAMTEEEIEERMRRKFDAPPS